MSGLNWASVMPIFISLSQTAQEQSRENWLGVSPLGLRGLSEILSSLQGFCGQVRCAYSMQLTLTRVGIWAHFTMVRGRGNWVPWISIKKKLRKPARRGWLLSKAHCKIFWKPTYFGHFLFRSILGYHRLSKINFGENRHCVRTVVFYSEAVIDKQKLPESVDGSNSKP